MHSINNHDRYKVFDRVARMDDPNKKGMIYLLEHVDFVYVDWDVGTYERVASASIQKIGLDRDTFDWRKVTEDYNKEKDNAGV